MNRRTLKIEATGDFAARKITPKIRLAGRWLERAGFPPGQRVAVEMTDAGCLTLRLVKAEQAQYKSSPHCRAVSKAETAPSVPAIQNEPLICHESHLHEGQH